MSSNDRGVTGSAAPPLPKGAPTWWVILGHELRGLWLGGKALHLILIYSILLGLYAFLFASNAELNLLRVTEAMLEVVKASIAFSLFITLIISAESVSGERERATLETLLLTPASRRQILIGKYLAALSPWPVALAMSIPFWLVLSKGHAVLGPALLWGVLLGGLLAVALSAIGLLVSVWSSTNRTSMLVCIGVYLLLLLPTELARPGKVMTVAEIKRAAVLQMINPFDAVSAFLSKILVYEVPLPEIRYLLATPVVFAVVAVVALAFFAPPGLRLRLGTRKVRAVGRGQRRAPAVATSRT